MIPRYARPEMTEIWSPESKFRIWFEIEAHATDALAELGVVPKDAAKKIWEKGKDAKFDVARIDEIEREVKHDVIAFLTHLSEIVGPEARFVHQGMTSSDVLDTCLNVQMARAADLLIADTDKLLAAIKTRAFEYKMTPTIGRSHGIHAEPTTFGVKLATYYAEFTRARARLVTARDEIATTKRFSRLMLMALFPEILLGLQQMCSSASFHQLVEFNDGHHDGEHDEHDHGAHGNNQQGLQNRGQLQGFSLHIA